VTHSERDRDPATQTHTPAPAPAGNGGQPRRSSEPGPRVVLMGAPIGIGNRGVSALGVSVAQLVCEARPDAEITLLIGSPESPPIGLKLNGQDRLVEVVNHRLSPRVPLSQQLWWIAILAALYGLCPSRGWRQLLTRRNRWIATVARADLVADIRGGDSFSDIYGLRRFLLGSLVDLCVIWVRGSIVLLPQTYGPYQSWMARWIARRILLRAGTILARDETSARLVRELTAGRRAVRVTPDVAFVLDSIQPPGLQLHNAPHPSQPPLLVGINVNGLMFNGGYTRNNMFGLTLDYRGFLSDLLARLLARPNVDVVLVPHTFAAPGRVESDNEACELLAATIPAHSKHRVHVVTEAYDQSQIKGAIGMCDFFIGSRMHACIAALSQGIPTVGIAYSRKFEGVFASVGAEGWVVDGRNTSAAQAAERVIELLDQRHQLKSALRAQVTSAQSQLRREFQCLLAATDV
jgi:colanic acid/amylovoran biosynthesis protein